MGSEKQVQNTVKKCAKKIIDICCYFLILPSYLRPAKKIEKKEIRKIALVNLQGIGDIVMITPFLSVLRKEFPGAMIDYWCYKENGSTLEQDKRITRIRKRESDDLFSMDFLKTLSAIQEEKYDCVINLFPSQHSAMLTVLSGARYKLGNLYNLETTSNNLKVKKGPKTWDTRENAASIAAQLGITEYDKAALSIFLSAKEKEGMKEVLKKEKVGKKFIVINPHATWQAKSWPQEYWKELLERLSKNYDIVIIGSKKEREATTQLLRTIKQKKQIRNVAGMFSLRQTASLLEKASLVITTDSGPMHIAIAMKTKTIALFGCTDPNILVKGAKNITILSTFEQCPKKWRFNHNNEPPKEAQEMMRRITVREVLQAVEMNLT